MRPLSAESRYPPQAGQRRVAVSAARPSRRDPAPSRLAFRLQRLWLTPLVRSVTRIGLPVFAVVLGLGLWLGDDGRRADIVAKYEDIKTQIQNRPEFRVSLLKIEGAGPEVDAAIRAMLPMHLPASSRVIRPGGTLQVTVTERTPAILWRTPNGLEMLDAGGHRVATLIDRAARPDLPLIAGEGADAAVPEALAVLRAAQPILNRARGLVRMGERRWDLVLDRDQRILLPAADPVRAVERLIALDTAEDLLDRDFTHLDLRNQNRPTIRLSAQALEQFRAITGQATKVKATQ